MARKLKLRRGAIVQTKDGSLLIVKGTDKEYWGEKGTGTYDLWDCIPLATTKETELWCKGHFYWGHELKVKGYADDI